MTTVHDDAVVSTIRVGRALDRAGVLTVDDRERLFALMEREYLKGGPGSGNFGHSGRVGKRGGSLRRGLYDTRIETVTYDSYPYRLDVDRNVLSGDPYDPVDSQFVNGYSGLRDILPQRRWDDHSRPDVIYRSMSAYEFERVRETGEIQSEGSMNLSGQDGMTFFDDDGSSMYAEDNFKKRVIENHIQVRHPDFPTPVLGDVAYIVGVRTPEDVQINQQGEYYTTHPTSASQIVRVIEARPSTYDPREFSFGSFGYRDVSSEFVEESGLKGGVGSGYHKHPGRKGQRGGSTRASTDYKPGYLPQYLLESLIVTKGSRTTDQLNALRDRILKNGITEPIWLQYDDDKITILDGTHRIEFAKEFGIDQLPVRVVNRDGADVDPEVVYRKWLSLGGTNRVLKGGADPTLDTHFSSQSQLTPELVLDAQAGTSRGDFTPDLKLWEKRVINLLKDKRPLSPRPFVSDIIPSNVKSLIEDGLESCQVVADVRSLFDYALKGGEGSGNFGHGGRLGKRGGSDNDGVSEHKPQPTIEVSPLWRQVGTTNEKPISMITHNAQSLMNDREDAFDGESLQTVIVGVSGRARGKVFAHPGPGLHEAMLEEVDLSGVSIDNFVRYRIYHQSKSGPLMDVYLGSAGAVLDSDASKVVAFNNLYKANDILVKLGMAPSNPLRIRQGIGSNSSNHQMTTLKGGAGSGNFGHEGRPGERGGSSDREDGESDFGKDSRDFESGADKARRMLFEEIAQDNIVTVSPEGGDPRTLSIREARRFLSTLPEDLIVRVNFESEKTTREQFEGIPVYKAMVSHSGMLSDDEIAESITRGGLKLGPSWHNRPPSVYFTTSEEAAHKYALQYFPDINTSDGYGIVEFRIPPGIDVFNDTVDQQAIGGGESSFRVQVSIDPKWITHVRIYDPPVGGQSKRVQKEFKSISSTGYAVLIIDRSSRHETKALPTTWRPWMTFEERMANLVQAYFQTELAILRQSILEQQSLNVALEAAMWASRTEAMLSIFQPIFEELVLFAINRVSDSISGITVDWNLVNTDAVNWSREFAAARVKDIEDTTREALGRVVADGLQNGKTLEEITDDLASMKDGAGNRIFDRPRAELIAITEVTTVFAEANEKAWIALGYSPARFKPSAHPRCRCRLQPYDAPTGEKVLMWVTSRDERVCTTPIDTPWRKIDGCKGLHRMIVSDGALLGTVVP